MADIFFTSDQLQHYGHFNIINYCNRPFGDPAVHAQMMAVINDESSSKDAVKDARRALEEYKRRVVEEHDETLIEKHNARVKSGDRVFMLGDFGMGRQDHLPTIFSRLNGQKNVLWGNHDRDKKFVDHVKRTAAWCGDYYRLRVDDVRVILFHYPIAEWDGCHKGYWHVHGHSHGTHPSPAPLRRLDAGVDVHDYAPISFEELRAYMESPERAPTPHHGRTKEL